MDMLNKDDTYVYEIKDGNLHKDYRCLVRSKINPEEMKNLLFYIQFKYQSIIKHDLLSADEIEDVLVKCYDTVKCDYEDADEVIDLNENFSRYFNYEKGREILDNSYRYEVSGLISELKKKVCLTVEMWR